MSVAPSSSGKQPSSCVADKFRLFFVLTPDRIRIVDVIWRDDLDRWITQLLARGLPPST